MDNTINYGIDLGTTNSAIAKFIKGEVIIFSNHLFKPRTFAIMIPNVLYDFNKVLLEKYFMWKSRKGYAFLP